MLAKSKINKWLAGVITSIVVGLFMWWITNRAMATPELIILESSVKKCNPTNINVKVFNSGNKIAENCLITIEFYNQGKSPFPVDYDDLLSMERLDLVWSDRFFIKSQEEKDVAIQYYYPKEYLCEIADYSMEFEIINICVGVKIEYGKKSVKKIGSLTSIYSIIE